MARVLIVDDAAFMRMMIKDILEKNDFEIVGEANNGIVAVDLYKKEKPDVVTMDITMPDMDGIEAVKQIKAFDPDAKVIMCSAMDNNQWYGCNKSWSKRLYSKTIPSG